MKRLTKEEYYTGIARAVAMRSTCLRKAYGAILVKNDRVIATGYNGAVAGEPHCTECTKCNNGKDVETYLSCRSCHAEMNCIISAAGNEMIGADLYLAGYDVSNGNAIECEARPCQICLRLIKNAGIDKVITRQGIIYKRNPLTNILEEILVD